MNPPDRWDAFDLDELHALRLALITNGVDGSLPEAQARITDRLEAELARALLRREGDDLEKRLHLALAKRGVDC